MAQAQLFPIVPCPFVFKDHQIRTIQEDNGALWFAAKDVCSALGIIWNGKALAGIPDQWQGMRSFLTPSGNQRLRALQEPGVYKLAFRSNKEDADEFTNWIASDVVPSIRETGQYTVAPKSLQFTTTPSTAADRAPLRALVFAWSQASGMHVSALWPQVKAHFQLARINDLPVEWIPDALEYVQGKIDALPKVLPVSTALPAAEPEYGAALESKVVELRRLIRQVKDAAMDVYLMTNDYIRGAKLHPLRSNSVEHFLVVRGQSGMDCLHQAFDEIADSILENARVVQLVTQLYKVRG
ncbi:hypothetical protein LJC59_01350 [Desulfovibrio sp. OttesenSCG-928-A18]|nr:hypothetical protein [Desulfovibrio sp. OttesenSCG-928-A18]